MPSWVEAGVFPCCNEHGEVAGGSSVCLHSRTKFKNKIKNIFYSRNILHSI
nr:MAG TPA: hypothetical protein [Caudoviricetes sp.]